MSFGKLQEVSLEVVRPGPAHNRTLSPTTQYMALCGGDEPVTFSLDFEHADFLSRLESLRYVTSDTTGRTYEVNPRARAAQLRQLGNELGNIFSRMPNVSKQLSAHLSNASADPKSGHTLVHFRMVLSGLELAIIPFEAATAPVGFVGQGDPLFVQEDLAVVPTREIRRSRPLKTRLGDFNEPKVLLVAAAPEGLTVPLDRHITALCAALGLWINNLPGKRREDYLHVLENATIDDIEDACSRQQFSHVHILAHGDTYHHGSVERYGVALCDRKDRTHKHVVSGERLAQALSGRKALATDARLPFWVTVATCDSGNTGSMMLPGGSIAYEMHRHGVPWVLASQLPLTKRGSVRLTSELYTRLLAGEDPRRALFETRRLMYVNAVDDHDWASLVVYASTPPDFDDEVALNFAQTTEVRVERRIEKMDSEPDYMTDAKTEALADVEELLDVWANRLPDGSSPVDRRVRTLCFGMRGSVFKRLALQEPNQDRFEELLERAMAEYEKAEAIQDLNSELYMWVASQFIWTRAALRRKLASETVELAVAMAERAIRVGDDETKVWALASSAELKLLQHNELASKDTAPPSTALTSALGDQFRERLQEIMQTDGRREFQVFSTRRQLERYSHRLVAHNFHESTRELAAQGVGILKPKEDV